MRQLKITRQLTYRETVSLDKYFQEIRKEDLITAEEEVALAMRIRQGDHEALIRLIRANLRFVVSVSKQYQNQGLSLPDLISEGNLGLIKAALRFDETRGFKFISYAVWWVRQSILQALAEHSRLIRLPLNKVILLNKLMKTLIDLEQKLGRSPELSELADYVGVPVRTVKELMRFAEKHLSVDAPLVNDEESTMLDVINSPDQTSPEQRLISESLRKEIESVIGQLTPREADVIRCYFGLNESYPMTMQEIGERFDLSRERVRQIKETAIKKLKDSVQCQVLKTYLGGG
ncbi:MAG TPA: RNA polymerase sigma factor RpoD/SigA [Bacteroidales bacterium]|nr:RNA polymerase sigma factor RpoD/SigA [Bacteroidales bacterium]HPR57739.1 RNA polymerase sigma factor RpoD/SigA [Bacteroidales bacterium]HRW96236.1 RNA polymerase sigma factor RpoD/SigA [Bacteroidales bacterium]